MLLNLMWSLSVQMLIPLNALLYYFSIVAIAVTTLVTLTSTNFPHLVSYKPKNIVVEQNQCRILVAWLAINIKRKKIGVVYWYMW